MFDTHCHLNFGAFKDTLGDVIIQAKQAGVNYFLVPGTDIETSERAVEIAKNNKNIYAAVGIHPHHVFELLEKGEPVDQIAIQKSLQFMYSLVEGPHVVAIGEIGVDKHRYPKTKYESYHTNEDFIEAQKVTLRSQIKLAQTFKKSVILHNREATDELLEVVGNCFEPFFKRRMVIHCCEPRQILLDFALKQDIFIGVDGDVTYDLAKQNFIKNVPLDRLVIETDSPFILPEPLKSQNKRPNTPANLPLIVQEVARLKNESIEKVIEETSANGKELFGII